MRSKYVVLGTEIYRTQPHPSTLFPSRYMWLYIIVLKDFLVYVLDIFTAITMLTSKQWSNQIFNDCPKTKDCVAVPFDVGRWLFVGCIIFGFLLVRYKVGRPHDRSLIHFPPARVRSPQIQEDCRKQGHLVRFHQCHGQ